MKKISSSLITAVLAVSLCACGTSGGKGAASKAVLTEQTYSVEERASEAAEAFETAADSDVPEKNEASGITTEPETAAAFTEQPETAAQAAASPVTEGKSVQTTASAAMTEAAEAVQTENDGWTKCERYELPKDGDIPIPEITFSSKTKGYDIAYDSSMGIEYIYGNKVILSSLNNGTEFYYSYDMKSGSCETLGYIENFALSYLNTSAFLDGCLYFYITSLDGSGTECDGFYRIDIEAGKMECLRAADLERGSFPISADEKNNMIYVLQRSTDGTEGDSYIEMYDPEKNAFKRLFGFECSFAEADDGMLIAEDGKFIVNFTYGGGHFYLFVNEHSSGQLTRCIYVTDADGNVIERYELNRYEFMSRIVSDSAATFHYANGVLTMSTLDGDSVFFETDGKDIIKLRSADGVRVYPTFEESGKVLLGRSLSSPSDSIFIYDTENRTEKALDISKYKKTVIKYSDNRKTNYKLGSVSLSSDDRTGFIYYDEKSGMQTLFIVNCF